MKKQFNYFQIFLFIVIASSCNSPKQAVTKSADATEAKSAPAVVKPEQSEVKPITDEKTKQAVESMTGSQIVDNAAASLNKRLVLKDAQLSQVKDILLRTFTGSGEDLNKSYPGEQAKTIKRDIIQKSKDSIMEVLDDQQKEKFKSFSQQSK